MAVARGMLVKKKTEVTIRRQCEMGGEEDEMSKLSSFPFGSCWVSPGSKRPVEPASCSSEGRGWTGDRRKASAHGIFVE